MRRRNSSGLAGNATKLRARSRSRNPAWARTAETSLFSRATSAGGVRAGATRPIQASHVASGRVDVPVAFVARDGIGIVDAAIGGAGVARIYDLSAGPAIEAGALEAVLPGWDSGRRPVDAVLPGRRNVPTKVRAFLEFMEALLAHAGGPHARSGTDA